MTSFSFAKIRKKNWKIYLMKSIKIILSLNLTRNIQNRNENYLTLHFTKMNNRGYKQLHLTRKQTDNLIFMQNWTFQCHLKKVFHAVKYCVSNFFFNKTANPSAIVKYWKSGLQKEIITYLWLKPKLRRWYF